MEILSPFTKSQAEEMKKTMSAFLISPSYTQGKWLVSQLNFDRNARSGMNLPQRVRISDITIREGQQTAESHILSVGDEIRLAKMLDDLGVDMIQVATHMSSEDVQSEVKQIAKLDLKAELVVCVTSLEEIEAAAKCGANTIEFFTGPKPALQPLFGGYAKTEEDQLQRGIQFVKTASKFGLKVRADINYSALAKLDFVERYFRSVAEAGADYLHIADSTGMMGMHAMRFMVSRVKEAVPNVPLGVHCHNDFGLGTASALASVEKGAEIVDVVIGGLGERAGLAALAEVSVALEALYGIRTGIRLDKLKAVHDLYAEMANYPLPKNKPIVGKNAFSNTIELHAMDEPIDPWLGIPFRPDAVGNMKRYYIGKYSGIFSFHAKLDELGLKVDAKQIPVLFDEAWKLLLENKFLSDEDIRHLATAST